MQWAREVTRCIRTREVTRCIRNFRAKHEYCTLDFKLSPCPVCNMFYFG